MKAPPTWYGPARVVFVGVLLGGLACGGGERVLPAPVKLDGCEDWTPPELPVPEPPTLESVLTGAPADFVTDFVGHGVDGSVGAVKGKVPQLVLQAGPAGPDEVFDAAKPFRPAAGERVWVVFRAVANADAGSVLGRNAEFAVQLGDATFEVHPGKGRFETHVSAPGVALKVGDRIRYKVSGGGALASEVGLAEEMKWNGEFPVVLGDETNGLEVRALHGEDLEREIALRLKALDDATLVTCRDDAILGPEVVPFWNLRNGAVESNYEDVAAVSGWKDPRLLARNERRDRIVADWRSELVALHATVLPEAVAIGDPISLDGGQIRVSTALACKQVDASSPWCPYQCEAVLEYSGDRVKDARESADAPILFQSGLVPRRRDIGGDKKGTSMTLSTCDLVAPDPDGPVLYRPFGGDAWMRLR